MPSGKPTLSEVELRSVMDSIDAVSHAVDALQDSVQKNAVDHATIKTKLEDVLVQLRSLAKTVRGDQGLLTRVSVLESRLEQAEVEIEQKAKEIREELNREISDVKSAISELRKNQEDRTQQELAEVKSQQNSGKSHRVAVWGAGVSTLAFVLTVIISSLQNCQHTPKADPPPAVEKK